VKSNPDRGIAILRGKRIILARSAEKIGLKEETVVCELMKLDVFEHNDDFVMVEGFIFQGDIIINIFF
jgi:hypothetical protein